PRLAVVLPDAWVSYCLNRSMSRCSLAASRLMVCCCFSMMSNNCSTERRPLCASLRICPISRTKLGTSMIPVTASATHVHRDRMGVACKRVHCDRTVAPHRSTTTELAQEGLERWGAEWWWSSRCELQLVAISRCVVVVHFHHRQPVKE